MLKSTPKKYFCTAAWKAKTMYAKICSKAVLRAFALKVLKSKRNYAQLTQTVSKGHCVQVLWKGETWLQIIFHGLKSSFWNSTYFNSIQSEVRYFKLSTFVSLLSRQQNLDAVSHLWVEKLKSTMSSICFLHNSSKSSIEDSLIQRKSIKKKGSKTK